MIKSPKKLGVQLLIGDATLCAIGHVAAGCEGLRGRAKRELSNATRQLLLFA